MPQPASQSDSNPSDPPFEISLTELEEIVSQLESGEKPLDESLALYERGVAALKRCHAVLDKAEKRIRLLVRGPAGEPALREAEMPAARAKESSRRQPRKAPGEKPQPETAAEPEEPAAEDPPPQNSAHPHVDAEPSSGQNLRTSVKTRPPNQQGKPGAGGTLFGSAQ